MTESTVKHLYISGRVQGVGYRHFIRTRAEELGLRGWVRNLNDGRVELLAAGEKQQVAVLIKQAEKGPAWARVERIEISEVKPDAQDRPDGGPGPGFRVRY